MDDDKTRRSRPRGRSTAGKSKADSVRAAKPPGRTAPAASEERAKKKSARLLLQRASRRPRASEKGEVAEDAG
ncbi:MAG: hypothetical protein Q7R45_11860, partial [Sulfuricaulis sp.]|nr:hypothetical protein [Sulfuricaulis sp.]